VDSRARNAAGFTGCCSWRSARPAGYKVSGALCRSRPTGSRRFESTNPTGLRFRSLLTKGDARVRFHREGFGRPKENLT
jgi:hypothetical protein